MNATASLNGAFNGVELRGQKKDASGKCFTYMAVSQDQQGAVLSVLLVPREERCRSSGRRWVISGVTIGLVGGAVILFGVLWLGRDTCQRWARGSPDADQIGLLV